jgi:hypothetical protein
MPQLARHASNGASSSKTTVTIDVHCDGAVRTFNVPRQWNLGALRAALEDAFGIKPTCVSFVLYDVCNV